MTRKRDMGPVHPGTFLKEEYLEPLQISQTGLAKLAGLTLARINQLVLGHRSITAETALRLARVFRTTPHFWLNLQAHYDLECAEEALGSAIKASTYHHRTRIHA